MTRNHLYLRAKPGRREVLLATLDRLEVPAAGREAGLLAVELQVPLDEEDSVLVWSAWSSPAHVERWLAGASCERLLREIAGLLADDEPVFRTYQVADAIR